MRQGADRMRQDVEIPKEKEEKNVSKRFIKQMGAGQPVKKNE